MTTLLILMPTGGHIDTPCVHSLMGLTQALSKRGIGFALRTYEWSDLVISRNYLLSVFLGLTKFSHALLLDSDMSFEPDLFFKLLDFDEDFTVAAYPQRRMPWAALRSAIEREAVKPEAERASTATLLAQSLRYNIPGVFEKGQPWPLERRDGFRKVPGAGTGFMLLKRAVPEKMAEMVGHLCSLADERVLISFAPKTWYYELLKKIGELFPGPSKTTRAYLHEERVVRDALEKAGFKVAREEMTGTNFYFSRLLEAKRV